MSSIFADQQRPRIRVPNWGGGRCGVSANEHSCAHHVTWSPNKLWRSTSIFNLGLIISLSSPQGRPRREPAADEGVAGNRVGGAISEILGSSPLPSAWGSLSLLAEEQGSRLSPQLWIVIQSESFQSGKSQFLNFISLAT